MNSEKLVHNYTDVEEQLFAELFREYEQRLYSFIVKIIRSDELAKDILQDVFLKLWSIRSRLGDIENINAFLYKLTENKVYDYLRTVAHEKKMQQELWNRLQNPTEDLRETIISREYDKVLEKAIAQLPPQRRKVYLLNRQEGKKQLQIAEELAISPNTVRNHLSEAFKQIGGYLKQNLSFFFSLL